ncbi:MULTISPECIES: DUF2986 domain-containing protein [Pseudoalteromonas]|uniref:DUF2986 domain-containing protein n=1 Tax=Pseudoalteromonas amylolytica TaxID=1859457 RepID=A0A1S1MWA0_9GAMM|nr:MULTISPECIES: DUF2986 domain-containing protein [Pseudoalteromonas]OHU84974.1 hypothetical protein BFC16_20000 [Pseudoalteromonas sp. JW3]OHU90075.1 hypothetical protein BET10_14975 [Pseudoalteromonas amylolytica]
MNRKKKIYETLKKKDKRANAKLHKSNKPRYISKAQRAALEEEQAAQTTSTVSGASDATSESLRED